MIFIATILLIITYYQRDRPWTRPEETGFLRQFLPPNRDLVKKPGFWTKKRSPLDRTGNPWTGSNRVSRTIFATEPRFSEETRFLGPPPDRPWTWTGSNPWTRRNRVSATIFATQPRFSEETRFLDQKAIAPGPDRKPLDQKKPGFGDNFGKNTEI